MKIKKVLRIIGIILFSLITFFILAFFISCESLYHRGLRSFPVEKVKNYSFEHYPRFNKLYRITTSDTPDREMVPIYHFNYLFDLIRTITSKDFRRMEEGWIEASITARCIKKYEKIHYDRSLNRQITEWAGMVWLSRHYTIDRCIDIIAHCSYFGNEYYGIKEAATGYFNKEPGELSDDEIVSLLIIMRTPFDMNKFPTRHQEIKARLQKKIEDYYRRN